MIKVHVVSGFLGAGKTTFLIKAVQAFQQRNEKTAVIENEIGEVGIDGLLLSEEGFKVYELVNGCICCTMKSDFVSTFLEIKDKICPDRVYIEHSGIFVLDSLFNILNADDIKDHFQLQSVTTVIDARHFLRHEEAYGEFLKSQVEHASHLIITKAENIPGLTIDFIIQSLKKMNGHADIVLDYACMDAERLIDLLESDNQGICSCTFCSQNEHAHNSDEHPHKHQHDNGLHAHVNGHHAVHMVFETLFAKPGSEFDRDELKDRFQELSSGNYGTIIRAKGFVKSKGGYFAVNYVDGDATIGIKLRSVPTGLEIIGLNLKREKLSALFQ